jgi:hypothetical protein
MDNGLSRNPPIHQPVLQDIANEENKKESRSGITGIENGFLF